MTKNLEDNMEEITLENEKFLMGVRSHEVKEGDIIQVNGDFEKINARRFDGIYDTWYETPHGEYHSCMIDSYGKRVSD